MLNYTMMQSLLSTGLPKVLGIGCSIWLSIHAGQYRRFCYCILHPLPLVQRILALVVDLLNGRLARQNPIPLVDTPGHLPRFIAGDGDSD